jgi:hypothetical protein
MKTGTIRKIGVILGLKGILCIASLTMVAMALLTYTAVVTINPTRQFTIGATTSSWSVYVNDVNKLGYLPGGLAEPTFNSGDPTTYAFKAVTDANKVCAVKIELTAAVNSSKLSNFNITVQSWTGSAWANETLYASSTGSATKSYIDGLTPGDSGYVHQDLSATKYYLIRATYSYDKTDETTQVTVTFQYTPLPQNSF